MVPTVDGRRILQSVSGCCGACCATATALSCNCSRPQVEPIIAMQGQALGWHRGVWCGAEAHRAVLMLPQVQTVLTNHVYAMLPAALIGIICGLLGILFTIINIKVGGLTYVCLCSKRVD